MLLIKPSLDTKVYPALGNHDYHPKSQLPAGPNYIYDQTAEMWQGWLDPESRGTFKKGWLESPVILGCYFDINTIAFLRITKTPCDAWHYTYESTRPIVSCIFFNIFLYIGGYYTEKLLNRTGFRMLVLNTNLYYDQNKATQDMDDPAGQFSWADQVLTEAANNKEKAKHLVYLCFATVVKLDLMSCLNYCLEINKSISE